MTRGAWKRPAPRRTIGAAIAPLMLLMNGLEKEIEHDRPLDHGRVLADALEERGYADTAARLRWAIRRHEDRWSNRDHAPSGLPRWFWSRILLQVQRAASRMLARERPRRWLPRILAKREDDDVYVIGHADARLIARDNGIRSLYDHAPRPDGMYSYTVFVGPVLVSLEPTSFYDSLDWTLVPTWGPGEGPDEKERNHRPSARATYDEGARWLFARYQHDRRRQEIVAAWATKRGRRDALAVRQRGRRAEGTSPAARRDR